MDVRPARQWHVDAWAVRDGLAFTSFRAPDDIQNAERTLFIAVPSLEAVSVSRVSTGLWATRANFQDGLVTEQGEEVGFESIDQVRELIRRGYLAGGIGPGPAGGEPAPIPPRGDGPRDRDFLEAQPESREGSKDNNWLALSESLAEPERRADSFKQLLHEDWKDGLAVSLRMFGEATVALWALEIENSAPDEVAAGEFVEWIQRLWAIGLWSSPGSFLENIQGVRAWGLLQALPPMFFDHDPFWWWRHQPPGPMAEQIIFRAPCPLRPGWDARIRRISDKLLLAVSTADYFRNNPHLPEFIPALLAALVVVQARVPLHYPYPSFSTQKLKAALDWLSQQMPQRELPLAAETALSNFAWGELGRTLP
ncbi:MAG: hypothetical protein ABJA77_11195 [Variovorax sp.]